MAVVMPAIIRSPLPPPAMEDLKEREMIACDPRRLLDEKRSDANRRERGRVRALTENFDALFATIPRDVAEPRLARIEIVRRAVGYIQFLTELLVSERPNDNSAGPRLGAWGRVPTCEDDLSSSVLRKAYLDMQGGLSLIPIRRAECNARARSRSKDTKAAFNSLKEKLPLYGTEPELSRLDILRRAADYIACMTLILEEKNEEGKTCQRASPPSPSMPSTPSTCDDHRSIERHVSAEAPAIMRMSSQSTDSLVTAEWSSTNDAEKRPSHREVSYPRTQSASSASDSDYATCSSVSPTSVCGDFFSFDDFSSPITCFSQPHSSPCSSPTLSGRAQMSLSRRLAHPYRRSPGARYSWTAPSPFMSTISDMSSNPLDFGVFSSDDFPINDGLDDVFDFPTDWLGSTGSEVDESHFLHLDSRSHAFSRPRL